MIRPSLKAVFIGLVVLSCLDGASALAGITYQMVAVGNAGNAADSTGYGAVAYEYGIGKYDVTIGQYTAFLNAVAATDTYSLYNSNMGSNGNILGIQRTGAPGGYAYSVIGSEDRPITFVSWFDAARFANWMTNGQGGVGTTETGAYSLVGGQTSGTAPAANPGASFYIPTENEWYKSAYYAQSLNGGSGGYYTYATQSNNAPGNQIGSAANQANYKLNGVFSVTQSPNYVSSQNYLTDVGAFPNSGSFYGTFDQNGNVFQWNDLNGVSSSSRGLRGGSWADASYLLSSIRGTYAASDEDVAVGFRLAGRVPSPVPEIDPAGMGSVLALVTGALGLLERRRLKVA
jgi:formylglycine-generating enzyme required for sulfatase activity